MSEASLRVVYFEGECDIARYPELHDALTGVPEDEALPILVDCSGVTALDSVFLSELLLAKRRWERTERKSAMLVSNDGVYRTLELADVLEKLDVFSDRESALMYLVTVRR